MERDRSIREGRMHRFHRSFVVGAALVAFVLVAASCSDDSSTPGGDGSVAEGLTGSVVVSGSSTVEPISSAVAELFAGSNPDVDINVSGPGTGDGFELFCNGETDINDASRPIEDDEIAACEEAGITYTELEVGLDGLTVMGNPANPLTCLNDGDLYALFGPESVGIDTWDGANSLAGQVGGTGGFPSLPLTITAPGEESGTYDAFIELSGIPGIAEAQKLPEDEWETLRKDYTASPTDNVIVTAAEDSDGALGFVGYAFAQSAGDAVKEFEIDGGDGCVAPSADTVIDGSYPLSRSLYIYVSGAAMARPEVQAFVDLYVSDAGLSESVGAAGYVPLPVDRMEATRQAATSAEGAASASPS
jgi:phosphate transport system substrate-binding protein